MAIDVSAFVVLVFSFDMLADAEIVVGVFVETNLLFLKVTHAVGVWTSLLIGALIDAASGIGSEINVSGAIMTTALEIA